MKKQQIQNTVTSEHTAITQTSKSNASPAPVKKKPTPPPKQVGPNATANKRPQIALPGEGRRIADFGKEVGKVLAGTALYVYKDKVSVIREDQVTLVRPAHFRTLAEEHADFYDGKESAPTLKSMSSSDATAVLESDQFKRQLRPLEKIGNVRLPVMRKTGRVELLPDGYDPESRTFTIDETPYRHDMPLKEAVEYLRALFAHFPFADAKKSLGVVLASMVTVYARGLVTKGSQVPAFLFDGDQPGLGKGLLVQISLVPVLGCAPTSALPRVHDEMRKLLLAAAIEKRPAVFFDNINGTLESTHLESFLTTECVSGRPVQHSVTVRAKKDTVVYFTGNGCTVGPDMARRVIYCMLTSAKKDPKCAVGEHLDEYVLQEKRPAMLAALWALVKDWDEKGKPEPTTSNQSFPAWSKVVGGIVENAGFECPCIAPPPEAQADDDETDMTALLAAIEEKHKSAPVKFDEVGTLILEHKLFSDLVPLTQALELTRSERRSVSAMLSRFKNWRSQARLQFVITGSGHAKRYSVEKA